MKQQFKPGDKVTYVTDHGKHENGIVKRMSDDGLAAFVVYNCNNEWSRYTEYTAARTSVTDLIKGWIALKVYNSAGINNESF